MKNVCLAISVRRCVSALAFASLSVAAHATQTTVPALRITAPNGATSVLIGTIHVPIKGLAQPAASVMDGAKQYVIEGSATSGPQPPQENLLDAINPAAQAALIDSVKTAPAGASFQLPKLPMAPWASSLTAAQLSLFRERVRCNIDTPALSQKQIGAAVDPDQITQVFLAYNSAAAAASIAERPCSAPGLLSRDDLMASAAKARGIQPTLLESQVDVDAKRKAVPEQLYRDAVYRALSPAGQRDIDDVVDAIARGDYDRVLRIGSRGFQAHDAAAFQQFMVTDRNLAWRPVLRDVLNKGNAVVVIGAGHFGGPQGLIALLKADGYAVQAITLPGAAPASP